MNHAPESRPKHRGADVDVLLMASGFSRRFGSNNKLLAPLGGKPLAHYTLGLVCSIPSFRSIVLIYADPTVAQLAQGLPVTCLHNENPQRGQRESVRLGVLASSAAYYLFCPCDQPLLDAQTIQAILDARAPGHIVIPSHKGQPGNPALFSAAFRNELLTLGPGQHARDVLRRHPDKIINVPLDSPLPLTDVDTPEKLTELESFL